MKKLIGLIAICASMAMFALPVFGDGVTSQPEVASQDQCTPEHKLAWYTEFRGLIKTDQAKAYELAKKWLACPEAAGEESITAYLKDKFVAPYEKARRKDQVIDLVYNKKDYAKAFEVGKAILVDEPENLKVIIDLAYAGYASGSPTYSADTLAYAQKAIQLIESGKVPDPWNPYSNKDEALGYLYNAIASLTAPKNPEEALKAWIKAAQFEGKIKKLPTTFASIAGAYNDGPYAKLSAEYEKLYKGKDETPESKLALENINQMMDRMIDALARGVALAGNDPLYQANKKGWMETLSTWYKFRHNGTEDGLPEMIASVLSKPLPPEPTPITTLPTAPASTPATGSTSSPAATTPASTVASGPVPANKPAATPTPTAPGPTSNAAQPAKTTTPVTTPKPAPSPKPKTKRNHRRN